MLASTSPAVKAPTSYGSVISTESLNVAPPVSKCTLTPAGANPRGSSMASSSVRKRTEVGRASPPAGIERHTPDASSETRCCCSRRGTSTVPPSVSNLRETVRATPVPRRSAPRRFTRVFFVGAFRVIVPEISRPATSVARSSR
jgi:hypothetical protein